jgi:hypothetical protein
MRSMILVAAFSLVSTAGVAQLPQKRTAVVPTAKAAATYPVQINIPQANIYLGQNPNAGPIIVVARCNATNNNKDLEGWVSQTAPATVADMVASGSGTDRQTITFVVPWGWNYRVNVAIPPGGACSATAWTTS